MLGNPVDPACGRARTVQIVPVEGVERESALVEGAWHDDVIMSVPARTERGRAGLNTPQRHGPYG